MKKARNTYISPRLWASSSSSSQQRAAVVNTFHHHPVLSTGWPISSYKAAKIPTDVLVGSLLIVPEFATFNSPWAVTSPRQSATSVLTKLSSPLLLYSCSTIHSSPKTVSVLSPRSLNGSPGIVVEVFITPPIDWQEIVGGGWFGHPSALRLLAMWWAICCFQEVKDYHIITSFSSCPQGNKHMEAHKVVTNKFLWLRAAAAPSSLLLPASYHHKIDIPLLLQHFAQLCNRKSDSLHCSLSFLC